MRKINYQALRDAAEKATQGEWVAFISPGKYGTYAVHTPGDNHHGDIVDWPGFGEQKNAENNARYIAAFNPEVVQALLDERERNQQYIKRRDQENEDIALTVGRLRVELEAANKRIAELESLTAPQLPQPAPVSVPEVVGWEDVPEEITEDDIALASAWAHGFNQCRAAMLQSGNFRENKNSSTNYPVIPSEVLSAILKVAKIRADFDDFYGDRRGIGDCLDEAEQELIVTINKYASQLAAEPIATNDVREQTAVPPVPVIQADVAQAIEKLKRKLVECNRYNYCADAVKGVEYACHAAMLQGDEPVTDNTNQQFESLSRGDK